MAFQPFLANRNATTSPSADNSPSPSSGGFQRLFDVMARPESATQPQSQLAAPKVDLVEENGRVSSIVVTCKCCERIELACTY